MPLKSHTMDQAHQLAKTLELQPHPEGGYFKEVYRSSGTIPKTALPAEYQGDRNYATGIYFLLTNDTFSAFHKIHQDEAWHFYPGDPLRIHMISPDGVYELVEMGQRIDQNQRLQYVVPGGFWFAAEVAAPGTFSLVGCTVAPGFDFQDFNLPTRADLTHQFPQHKELIHTLTRE